MTRQCRSLPGFLAFAFLLLALPSYAAWMQDRKTELPQDEQKLLEYAQTRQNTGDWREADRAYKAFLEKFPDSKRGEEVYTQLANLHHWYSNQYAASREWYLKACEKYPKSPNYWNWRMQAASTWQNQNLREKAIEEYRKIAKDAPDENVRTNAIQSAWNVEGKYMYLQVNQSFTAGQQPFVNVQLSKIDKIAFRAEHIKFDAILKQLGTSESANLHEAIGKVGKDGRRSLQEWTATYTYDKNNHWKNEQVKVPSTESGVYIVQGEHDGVVMTVTLFVSQYGLITKASAGKLLCFAQERATSKPVEGMSIRTLHAQKPLNGVTDANGLFVSDDFQGGVVIGVKGTDLVTTQSYYGGAQGEQPLIYVTTDRPIYRPNHTVQFEVVHRSELGQKLLVKPGETFMVEVRDPKGNKVYEKKHVVGPFGSTTGSLLLGDEPALGEYTILTRGLQDDANLHQWNWQWMGRWGNQPWNGVRFRVDEYRKPEYKVDVAFKKKTVLQGEDAEATIDSRYYFGSPVVDAEVQYTVTRRAYWYSWRYWAYYYDWYINDEDGDGEDDGPRYGKHGRRPMRGYYGGEQVLQGTGRTNKDGKFVVPFTTQKWDHDAVYDLHAKVTDLSRRVVEGGGSCKATRAEFGLAMSLNKYVYKPGDKVNARVRATTADDKIVSDQKITIRGYDRRWDKGNYNDSFLFEGTSKTDGQGIADFNFTPEIAGGYLRLVAEAEDRRGNKVTTEHWVWMCGDSWYGDTVNLNGLDLILDKKTYDIGDTARVLVTSQFKNVSFLFTVEGKEIHQHQVVTLKGHTKTIEFKIDQSYFAPNVYIGITAIKEDAFISKQKLIIVNPSEKFIKVDIKPDQSQYRPRNKARYEITTTGADGKPVAAEVAFGIVDDSIYALQEEYAQDIRRFFIHRRGIEVATSNSLQYYDYGRLSEKRKAGEGANESGARFERDAAKPAAAPMALKSAEAKDDAGGGGAAYAATEVRTNFADTMLWKTVTTDASGRVVVEVDVPDNLTTWRATARAMTADSRFGQELNSVVCRKEMIVRLETPRFFTQNDETVVSAVVHNYLDSEKNVKIEFEAEGIEVAGETSMIVKVESEGQKRIDWKAKIKNAGRAKITVKALSDQDSDAMQLVIPVLAHGAMKWDSRAGVVDGTVTEKIVIPAGSVKGGSELMICVSPTHAAMVLDALEYLAGYPYGCVEQTMSRFLPTVVVGQALQKLGLEKPELKAELPSMVATGLQRLYNFQQQDGGWGWWQHDQSNPWTTAYVMTGLALARESDFLVSPEVFTRGQQSLRAHLTREKDANVQAYLLYALRMAGESNDVVRSQLTDKLDALNSYSKALLALVLKKDNRPTRDVLASLSKAATVTGGSAHFEGGERGGWMDHRIEVSAAALRAYIACEPKHELVPKLVSWLALSRQGNYWASTKQTAMVVYGLVDYLALTGDLNPDMTVTLSLNGDKVFTERVTKANWQTFQGTRKFNATQLNAGENTITIEKTGNGTPIYSVYAKYYAEAEDMPASQGGIRIERTYYKIVRENGAERLQKLDSGATVTSGDELEVAMTVNADRDYEWLMMDDPLPSGFEPIREYWGHYGWFWNYWYSRKEFRDQKVSIAMTRLWHGNHDVRYRMRAETPGDFHALPTQVFNMYHPEIGGNGQEFRIKVVDKN